jgi:hypothetical protein
LGGDPEASEPHNRGFLAYVWEMVARVALPSILGTAQANALRALLKAEVDRGPDFLRLANALSALYPKDGEEKQLLDAMLLAVPR